MKNCKRGHSWDGDAHKQCPECKRLNGRRWSKLWRLNNLEKAREYGRKYYQDNKEQMKESARTWWKNNPERVKNRTRRQKYGIEPEQYEAMILDQGNKCAICKTKDIEHIDHCHKIGSVRGLLCRPCNLMIGFADDNPEVLRLGAEYLEGKE